MDENGMGMCEWDGGMLWEVGEELIGEGKKDKGKGGVEYGEKMIGGLKVG